MPRRPRLSDRIAADARGQEAVYGPPSTVDGLPSTVDPAGSWENTHRRVTFYCPQELLAELEAEMDRSRRSKSRVITDALRRELAGKTSRAS